LDLKPEQIIFASVVRGGLDKAELELGRQRFSAATKVPLSTGQLIQAQVVRTSPFIELRLIDRSALVRLLQALPNLRSGFDLSGLLGSIDPRAVLSGQSRCEQYAATLDQAEGLLAQAGEKGQDLAGLLRFLGLDLENCLATGREEQAATRLKAALLALVQGQQGSQEQEPRQAQTLIDQLEAWQLCRWQLAQSGKEWLPLPFFEQGYLLAEREPGQDGAPQGQAGLNLDIFLELDRLGKLNIHINRSESGLSLRVLCETRQVARRLDLARQELTETVQVLPVKEIQIGLGAVDPTRHLLELIAPAGQRSFEAWA
jgi:hypothetical protein